jgi:hypothetical protein
MSARASAAGLALLLLAACSTPESRVRKHKELFDSYPPEIQQRIKAGEVDLGFTSDMVLMALGKPARKTTRTTAQSVQEIWNYGDSGVRPGVGVSIGGGSYGGFGGVSVGSEGGAYRDRAAIVFESGKVVAVDKVK